MLNQHQQHHIPRLTGHGSFWHILFDHGYRHEFGPACGLRKVHGYHVDSLCRCKRGWAYPWWCHQHSFYMAMGISTKVRKNAACCPLLISELQYADMDHSAPAGALSIVLVALYLPSSIASQDVQL